MVTKKDLAVMSLLWILAIMTRLPFLDYPKTVVFDERLTATFALYYLHSQPYFDVHPPLVPMVIAAVIESDRPRLQNLYTSNENRFGDFPYVKAREINLVLGIILPVLIYLAAKQIYGEIFPALLAAMLTLTDNSLVLFSRLILSDMYLLVTGFTAVVMFMTADKVKSKTGSKFLIIAGSVFLGLAISVKWIGLVFVSVILIRLWLQHLRKAVFAMAGITVAVHILIWLMFFGHMQAGFNPPFSIYTGWYPAIHYPAHSDSLTVLTYLPGYFVNMFGANSVFYKNGNSSFPLGWPANIGQMLLDRKSGKALTLTGNYIGWWSVAVALIVFAFYFSTKKKPEDKGFKTDISWVKLVIAGYGLSFLPWFFVGRAVFIYHYLTPVIFGYLLVPGAYRIIENKFIQKDRRVYIRSLYTAILILVFIFQSPITYGFIVPDIWFKWLIH